MKKFLLLTVASAAFTFVQAQDAGTITKYKGSRKNVATNAENRNIQQAQPESGTIIWSSDFSNPALWNISNGAGNSDNWVIRTTGPGGSFAIPAIASPTAANGFALFDSDSLCSGNQNAFLRTAAPINLSAYNNVVLRFYQQYRRFNDTTFVQVSTNGTTWTNLPFANLTLTNNSFAGTNPNEVNINISAIAGGQDSVWIRFNFFSPSSMGAAAGCGYAWMIDDVSLIEAVPNDITMDKMAVLSSSRFDVYGTYSTRDYAGDSLVIKANYSNIGALAQPNTRLEVTVRNAAGATVATQNSAIGNVVPGRVDSVQIAGLPFTAFPVGRYTVIAEMKSDSVDASPANNRDTTYFDVTTDSVSMAIRQPLATASLGTNSFPAFPGAEDDFRCANVFETFNSDTLAGIFVKLALANAGGLMTAEIRPAATLGQTVIFSDLYTLTAADVANGYVFLPFEGDIAARTLAPGDYYASVSLFSNANATHIRVLDDITNEPFKRTQSSLIYTADDMTWYINGIAFALDVVYGNPPTSVTELNNQSFNFRSVYPNPAQNEATLAYELKRNEQVNVVVRDMRGRVVLSENLGMQTAGTYNHSIQLNGMNAGLYLVELQTGSFAANQRLVITK